MSDLKHEAETMAGAPGETTQVRLLDSVAAITHHRDTGALDHSLILTLAELTAASSVALAKRASDGSVEIVCTTPNAGGGYDAPRSVADPDAAEWTALRHGMEQATTLAQQRGGLHRLLVPILHEGRVIGALQLDSRQPPEASSPLAEGFARIYANYTALLYESERDKLTGLYNRRSLERRLQHLLLQHEQSQAREGASTLPPDEQPQVWLAIIDIDHFKRVNDTWGHILGDEVILLLAQQMGASFRRNDVLFRFGGEEFVVLLGEIGASGALTVLERFRQQVAERSFPQVGQVTVSVGYASVGRHDYPESVLGRADKALYYAKEHGRNQVHGYDELHRRGLLGDSVAAGSVDLF